MKSIFGGIVVGALLLFSSLNAAAAEQRYYKVAATVAVDGREIMHPSAIVEASHPARIEIGDTSANSYRVEFTVTPGEGAHSNDQANIEVSFFTKVMGNWTLRSQPSLVVWTGQEASVESPYHEGTVSPRAVKITTTVTPKTQAEMLKLFNGKIPVASTCPPETDDIPIVARASFGSVVTPQLKNACCSAACGDGSGQTLRCCGAASCSGCGASCSP
ncbi:MAG TPA: hypothetical protein VNZ27_09580 [Rhodanobacter sp.]|jgi:hypothetical protein|nr:hypothetical protein [Rhodanobacter sp.]